MRPVGRRQGVEVWAGGGCVVMVQVIHLAGLVICFIGRCAGRRMRDLGPETRLMAGTGSKSPERLRPGVDVLGSGRVQLGAG